MKEAADPAEATHPEIKNSRLVGRRPQLLSYTMCRATYTGNHHHERFKHTLIELTGRILVMADEICNDFQMNLWKLA
jgi:hypothetical protein